MAYFYRLIATVLFGLACGALFSPNAHASFPPVSIPTYCIDEYCGASKVAACAAYTAYITGQDATLVNISSDPYCDFNRDGGAVTLRRGYAITNPPASCPAGSTESGGQCTCTPPNVENPAHNGCIIPNDDTKCQDAALLDSAAFGPRNVEMAGKVSSGDACLPVPGVSVGKGCKVSFNRSISYQRGNDWISEGTYSFPGATSSSCDMGTGAVPAKATPDTCKNGYPGQVNGVTVCIPISKTTPTVTDSTNKGTTTTADGVETKETTSNTTCTNGSCNTTTSTSVTNSTGTSTSTSTTSQSKGEFCAKNPKSDECGEGGSFSGDCTAGFTFEGDAIQGAMAREIYNQNCLVNKDTDESSLYVSEKAKTGDQTGDLPGNETVNVGPGDFDSSDAIGGAACITDKTVTVWGKSIVLPFSTVCPVMGYLKTILLAISYLTAAGIVIGRKS